MLAIMVTGSVTFLLFHTAHSQFSQFSYSKDSLFLNDLQSLSTEASKSLTHMPSKLSPSCI